MPIDSLKIAPSPLFWQHIVQKLLQSHPDFMAVQQAGSRDFSRIQVIVPAFSHARLFTDAMSRQVRGTFIPPQINTLSGLLTLQMPAEAPPGYTERLMQLYAGLRGNAWLKETFAASNNTDLLPLAQTLLSLSDELTQKLLPETLQSPEAADQRWDRALATLGEQAQAIVSQEAALVKAIWQSQLESRDPQVIRFGQLQEIAKAAVAPLVWISPVPPEPLEMAFLTTYADSQSVLAVTLDWDGDAVPDVYRAAWPEINHHTGTPPAISLVDMPTLRLCAAQSLDDAATKAAQTILNWLQANKKEIAVVAQDRVMARRLRALLERAQVFVADETGWMLSTTRAAAAIASWFSVVISRAETTALLDFLKLPFLSWPDKQNVVMQIESTLRRENIGGEWKVILNQFEATSPAFMLLKTLEIQANLYLNARTLSAWSQTTLTVFEQLQMRTALAEDAAGKQVLSLLEDVVQQGAAIKDVFLLAEWRVYLNLELDSTAYIADIIDRRVVMLPLNGARLRPFDAVLVMGADEKNLPSKPKETLFFSNAVKKELGLVTREERHLQQLRDVTELILTNREVVFCWQEHQNNEPNPVSPWIARLQLSLQKSGLPALETDDVTLPDVALVAQRLSQPAPSAGVLLPTRLSSSGLNTLLACPYQYFAKYMLRMQTLDELSDAPEKRDYGNWLHQILEQYHKKVRDHRVEKSARETLLTSISNAVFDQEMKKFPGALAYAVRWSKVIPAYVQWANQREDDGWYFVKGESTQKKLLPLDTKNIELYGRIDRIDQGGDGAYAVLDYKTRNAKSLQTKMQEDEDYQLAFYGLLFDQPLYAAHYVALEMTNDVIESVEMTDVEFENKQIQVKQLITTTMQQINAGAAMPAHGIAADCQYCDVKGFCRKGAW
jgi:ATP-dependent helicase/nuclease subunit B